MRTMRPEFVKLTPHERLHQLPVPIIGLTGGIASGKSTVSKMLLHKGVPVIDADKLVKEIYQQALTVNFIQSTCPEAMVDGKVNFTILRKRFFEDSKLKASIEAFIYQKLPEAFKKAFKALGSPPYVIYDVPLLFEKKLEKLVDVSILVYSPRNLQKERLVVRDGQAEEMAETILAQQIDIEEKKQRADFVIDNSYGLEELSPEVERVLKKILISPSESDKT